MTEVIYHDLILPKIYITENNVSINKKRYF